MKAFVGAIELESHNLQAGAAAIQGVVNSSELEIDSYRISTDRGDEIVGWPDKPCLRRRITVTLDVHRM